MEGRSRSRGAPQTRAASVPSGTRAGGLAGPHHGPVYRELLKVGKGAGYQASSSRAGDTRRRYNSTEMCPTPRNNGRDTMDAEPQQPSSEESREEAALLKLQEEFRHLVHECGDCRREIESHWQFCAHCGTRLATHCPGCGNPLPPPGAHACPRCGLALPQVAP